MAAVLAGNPDMYARLVVRYQHVHRRFAVRMLGSPDDADDALQLAFVRAFWALGRCKAPDRFAAWLFQIVINECRTLAARRSRRERQLVRNDAALAATAADTAEAGRNAFELEEIRKGLDQLDPEQREAFLLKHVEELSYDEMAELTGVGVSALKMRVKRACHRLRELLDKVPHDE